MTRSSPMRLPRGSVSDDPLMSGDYTVTVNGEALPVHGAKSCQSPWPFRIFKAGERDDIKLASLDAPMGPAQIASAGNAPYAFAGFSLEGPATVTITSRLPLDDVRIAPSNAAAVDSIRDNLLTLTVTRPTKISIEPRGRHGGLLLFVDPPESDMPEPDERGVHYFGPGHHHVGLIELRSGETLYLARDAVVEGGIRARGANDIRILGRGILCGDPWGWRDGPQPHMVMLEDCQNVLVEGVTLRCSWQWTIRMMACRNVTIRNLKNCQGKNLNDDGINPCSSSDILIEDCFIRTQDDNISVKAHCEDRRPSERITVRRCLLWSDLSRILMIGPESHADRIGDVDFHECEILHLGPPISKAGFGDWNGCAPAFSMQAGEDCMIEHIDIRNVTVHMDADRDGMNVVVLHPEVNQFMKRRTFGRIRDVAFTNVAFVGAAAQPRILIRGQDPQHQVENVTFRHCTVQGMPLTGQYPGLTTGDHTEGIRLLP